MEKELCKSKYKFIQIFLTNQIQKIPGVNIDQIAGGFISNHPATVATDILSTEHILTLLCVELP